MDVVISCTVQHVGDVEEHVHVQRVLSPGSQVESWTVLGEDGSPIGPVERFLAYLSGIERSPNTVRAYAHDLKDYWSFLAFRGLDWREVRLEDVAEFVAWLRLPPSARDGRVALLATAQAHVGAATVNRKLSAVAAFYVHQARNGVGVGELLTTWAPGRRGGWKPFLHHVSKSKPHARRLIALRATRKLPRVLTVAEMQAILDGCVRLRDRFMWALSVNMRVLRMKNVLIASFDMEVGGVERSLISMLDNFDYKNYKVDLMLYRHQGDFMSLVSEKVTLLEEIAQYTTFRKSIREILREKQFAIGFSRIISKINADLKREI